MKSLYFLALPAQQFKSPRQIMPSKKASNPHLHFPFCYLYPLPLFWHFLSGPKLLNAGSSDSEL